MGPIYTDFRCRGAECTTSIPKIVKNSRKCSAPIEAPVAQTRKCSTQAPRVLGGRNMGKGTRATHRGQYTPISGAEALSAPSLSLRLLKTVENVQLQSRRLSPKLGSVPLRRHGFSGVGIWGRGPGLHIGVNIHRFPAPRC